MHNALVPTQRRTEVQNHDARLLVLACPNERGQRQLARTPQRPRRQTIHELLFRYVDVRPRFVPIDGIVGRPQLVQDGEPLEFRFQLFDVCDGVWMLWVWRGRCDARGDIRGEGGREEGADAVCCETDGTYEGQLSDYFEGGRRGRRGLRGFWVC